MNHANMLLRHDLVVRSSTRSWRTCSSRRMRGERPATRNWPEGTIGSGDGADSRTVARRAAKRSGSPLWGPLPSRRLTDPALHRDLLHLTQEVQVWPVDHAGFRHRLAEARCLSEHAGVVHRVEGEDA